MLVAEVNWMARWDAARAETGQVFSSATVKRKLKAVEQVLLPAIGKDEAKRQITIVESSLGLRTTERDRSFETPLINQAGIVHALSSVYDLLDPDLVRRVVLSHGINPETIFPTASNTVDTQWREVTPPLKLTDSK